MDDSFGKKYLVSCTFKDKIKLEDSIGKEKFDYNMNEKY